MPSALPNRPITATLSVTKAARLLGVHLNTVRAWSDAGRLRYYRINPRATGATASGTSSASCRPRPAVGRELGAIAGGDGHRRRALASPAADPPCRATPTSRTRGLDLRRRRADAAGRVDRDVDRALQRAVPGSRERWASSSSPLGGANHRSSRAASVRPRRPPCRHAARQRHLGSCPRPRERPPHHARPWRGSRGAPTRRRRRLARTDRAEAPAEVAVAIPGPSGSWGVLLVAGHRRRIGTSSWRRSRPRRSAGSSGAAAERAEVTSTCTAPEALRRVASDIGSRLELDRIPAGSPITPWCFSRRTGPRSSCATATARRWPRSAAACRRPTSAASAACRHVPSGRRDRRAPPSRGRGYRDDPRGADVRAAVVQEGFDTVCSAPLFDGAQLSGRSTSITTSRITGRTLSWKRWPSLATSAVVAIRTPRTTSRWRPGPAAPVNPAARHPAQPPDRRQGDRLADRQ